MEEVLSVRRSFSVQHKLALIVIGLLLIHGLTLLFNFHGSGLIVATYLGFISVGMLLEPVWTVTLWWPTILPVYVIAILCWMLLGKMLFSSKRMFIGVALLLIVLHSVWATYLLLKFV